MMPFPTSNFVDCECERCGFKGQPLAEMPHVCLVMVNLDLYEAAKKDAERYRWLRDKANAWSLGKIKDDPAQYPDYPPQYVPAPLPVCLLDAELRIFRPGGSPAHRAHARLPAAAEAFLPGMFMSAFPGGQKPQHYLGGMRRPRQAGSRASGRLQQIKTYSRLQGKGHRRRARPVVAQALPEGSIRL